MSFSIFRCSNLSDFCLAFRKSNRNPRKQRNDNTHRNQFGAYKWRPLDSLEPESDDDWTGEEERHWTDNDVNFRSTKRQVNGRRQPNSHKIQVDSDEDEEILYSRTVTR